MAGLQEAKVDHKKLQEAKVDRKGKLYRTQGVTPSPYKKTHTLLKALLIHVDFEYSNQKEILD